MGMHLSVPCSLSSVMTVSVMGMVSRSFLLLLLLYFMVSFLDGIKCANVSNVTVGENESVTSGRDVIVPPKLPEVRIPDLVQGFNGTDDPSLSRNETDSKGAKEPDIVVTEKGSPVNERPESVTIGTINRTEPERAISTSAKSMASNVTESTRPKMIESTTSNVTESANVAEPSYSNSSSSTESTIPVNTGMRMNGTESISPRSTTMYMLWFGTTKSESPEDRIEFETMSTVMNGSSTERLSSTESQSVGSTTEFSVIETDEVVSEEPMDEEPAIDLEENVTVTLNETVPGNEIVTVTDVTVNETSKVNETVVKKEVKIANETNQQFGLAEDYDSTSTSIYESTTCKYRNDTFFDFLGILSNIFDI